jgi:hypothetical protein
VSKAKKKQSKLPRWIVFVLGGGWIIAAGAMLFVSKKPNWLIGVFLLLTGLGLMFIRPVSDKREQQITLLVSILVIAGGILVVTLSIANGWN